MESTPRLSDTLVDVFSQHDNWRDRRHRKTVAWMMVGLIQSQLVRLTAWVPSMHSRALSAQSLLRRVERWLHTNRLAGPQLSGPLMPQALAAWAPNVLSLALDPSTLWATYGMVRMALIDRGRAIPMVWKVLQHPSRRVADEPSAA